MEEYPVEGQLRVRHGSLKRDLQFIKERVAKVSEPQPAKPTGDDLVRFWWVEFTATTTQWQAIQPELKRLDILATLYETPDLYSRAQEEKERVLAETRRKGKSRLISLAGAAIFLGGLVSSSFVSDATVSFCLVGIGILVMIIGSAVVQIFEEKVRDAWRMRKMRR